MSEPYWTNDFVIPTVMEIVILSEVEKRHGIGVFNFDQGGEIYKCLDCNISSVDFSTSVEIRMAAIYHPSTHLLGQDDKRFYRYIVEKIEWHGALQARRTISQH